MTIRRNSSRAPARFGVLLAALALFVRLIVPAGFMPMATAGGAPTLVICTGQGPMVMPMPAAMQVAGMQMAGMADHQAPADHDGDMANHGCFLAAVGGAVDIAAPIAPLPLPFVVGVEQAVVTLVAQPGLGLAAPPPPKTGPPIVA